MSEEREEQKGPAKTKLIWAKTPQCTALRLEARDRSLKPVTGIIEEMMSPGEKKTYQEARIFSGDERMVTMNIYLGTDSARRIVRNVLYSVMGEVGKRARYKRNRAARRDKKEDNGSTHAMGVDYLALAKPPRNCDVGTLAEQQQRFHDFCEKMQHTDKACCGGCPIVRLRMQGVINNSCELAWAQMPYEEGGAK